MGKLSRGFLGGFQGQLGTAYGCFWRLMDLIKAMPRKSNKPPTAKQLDQQLKWALITNFMAWLAPVVKIGFQNKPSNQSAMNAAVGYNIKEAVTGMSPNYTLDYTKIRLSEGTLEGASEPEVENVVGSKLKFNWVENSVGTLNSFATDKLTFVVFNPIKWKFILLQNIATREDLTYTMQLPMDFVGDDVKAYVTVTREDDKLVSMSQFLASTIVT